MQFWSIQPPYIHGKTQHRSFFAMKQWIKYNLKMGWLYISETQCTYSKVLQIGKHNYLSNIKEGYMVKCYTSKVLVETQTNAKYCEGNS